MKRFITGFLVTLVLMMGLGWLFTQSVYLGWGLQSAALTWLLFTGTGHFVVSVVAGLLWAWLGNSKSGRFSGVVRYVGIPTDGRGCQIFSQVTIGGVAVGTAVVPDALLEQWQYPSPTVTGHGTLDVLKIGRAVVALNSGRGFTNAWSLRAIHRAYPFLSMGFFAITLVTMGAGALVTYLPVYLWGAMKCEAFKKTALPNESLSTSNKAPNSDLVKTR